MRRSTFAFRATSVAVLLFGASQLLLRAQAPDTAPAPVQKTAEQQFKNIQVLKGIPADQLIPTMQFISASLGVECDFCHVEHAFDKDDKKPKQVARKMIQMQMAINQSHFRGETEVTCNTCHRGSEHPMSVPAVADANWKPEAPEKAPSTPPQQDANSIIARYIAALGGTPELNKVKTLTEKGTASFAGRQMPIDIYAQAPDQRVSVMHMPNGDSVTAYNGKEGWLALPGRPTHDMSSSEAEGARLDALFTFPANLAQQFTRLRVGRPDQIDGRPVTVIFGMREGEAPVRLFFEDQSGMLVRMVRYARTPLGANPTQVDYADYRSVNGVKLPHQWTIARPGSRFTITVSDVRLNGPIDKKTFAHPAEAPPPQAK